MELEHSYSSNPFNPSKWNGRLITSDIYECECKQRWWRFNNYYQLWSPFEKGDTIKDITAALSGTPE